MSKASALGPQSVRPGGRPCHDACTYRWPPVCCAYDRLFIGVQGGLQGVWAGSVPVRGAMLGTACSGARVTESQPRLSLQRDRPLSGQMGTYFLSFPGPWDEQSWRHGSHVVLSN